MRLIDPKHIENFFSIDSAFTTILRESSSAKDARSQLYRFLDRLDQSLQDTIDTTDSLETALQNNCTRVLRSLISLRSEKISGFQLVHALRMLALDQRDTISNSCTEAFIEDLSHLVKGVVGKSGIYSAQELPEFLQLQGRQAARVRSDELDKMADEAQHFMSRYTDGLDRSIIDERRANRQRILDYFNADSKEWDDYLWQIRHVIRNSTDLANLIQLTADEKKSIDSANQYGLPFGITPYYISLMDYETHRRLDHAVRAQVIPPPKYIQAITEKRDRVEIECDFMHEHDTSPIDLITRRYPKIAIFKPYNTCSQICVYCQRNWEIDNVLDKNAMATKRKILEAIDWIKNDSSLTEVLVTGGDPLVMRDERVEFVLSQLANLEQIERIRIGSRTPVVLPQRITDSLIRIISQFHQPGKREIALVTHFEHPYEITPESMEAVQKFRRAGISVYNQAVFTVENSRKFELVALRRLLRLIGVDPYYSFNTKGKEETENYRVPIARLQQEIREEARLFPGLVRTDEAVYNVPRLGKNYLRADINHSLLTILPEGKRVYEFFPWERFIARTETYIDTDVPIALYLRELERRGENVDDYRTIWYYF
ncbi:KamA family radical SAM protein [candidate division KSB1 bacterium]|nr:KamA family radical SAM protein [candidate division KSB1 bacterium]